MANISRKNNSVNLYKQALQREKKARNLSEELLENKTRELYFAKEKLQTQNIELQRKASENELLLTITHFNHTSNKTFDEAMQNFVDAVCQLSGWPVGHVFFVTEDNNLVSSDIWHFNENRYTEFKQFTAKIHYVIGLGLPGRVLENERDIWIEDVCHDSNFPRKEICTKLGIHGAFAAPIKIYHKLIAIVEFFSSELKPKDDRLMQSVQSAINQLGIMLERRQAELESEKNYNQLQKALCELRQLANYDWLTDLPNRYSFEDTLKREIAKAERNHYRLVLLFIDLDNFKKINDSMGHNIGDILLQKVAHRLKNGLRKEDFIARLGGDEFAIITTHLTTSEAQKLAKKILAFLKEPYTIEGYVLHVSASIGIASYAEGREGSISLTKNADIAMYNAKDTGRNKFRVFTSSLRTRYLQRLNLENDLLNALQQNEFFLVYQPKYRLKTNELMGVEALLRWNHKKLGLVSPEIFIPIAEETGLITKIGEWVLRTACGQYVEWIRKDNMPFDLSVNVSPQQLLEKSFIKSVSTILNQTHMPTNRLELEITETAAMSNKILAEKQIRKLTNLGIKISIDDFGTGYSSLSLLKRLPIHTLKIDKSFISGIGVNENDTAIVASTIALAKTLGLQVIAEGVENAKQLQYLLSEGCYQAQGFYLSVPLSPHEIEKLISKK